jgi:hypothetical protein
MTRDLSAGTSILGQHDQGAHPRRMPTEALGGDPAGQPHLYVERPEQPVQRTELRLDLHHQERPTGPVPGEDIDGATLTVLSEADLYLRLPTPVAQELERLTTQPRVTLVEQPIHSRAVPERSDLHPRTHGFERSHERADRDSVDIAALDPCHRRPAAPSHSSNVLLP